MLVDAGGYPPHATAIPLGFRLARLAPLPLAGALLEHILPRSLVEQGFRNIYGDSTKVTREQIDPSSSSRCEPATGGPESNAPNSGAPAFSPSASRS